MFVRQYQSGVTSMWFAELVCSDTLWLPWWTHCKLKIEFELPWNKSSNHSVDLQRFQLSAQHMPGRVEEVAVDSAGHHICSSNVHELLTERRSIARKQGALQMFKSIKLLLIDDLLASEEVLWTTFQWEGDFTWLLEGTLEGITNEV